MKIVINIEKRFAYIIIGILLLILGVLAVLAYNSGQDPSFAGHTAEELDLSGGVNGVAVFNYRVGIGKSNPISRLDVDGTITTTQITPQRICLPDGCISSWNDLFAKIIG